MAFSFADKPRYEESFTLIEQSEISEADRKIFKEKCLCVHGTFGKSLKFFAHAGFTQYLSCNPASSAQVGQYYDVSEVVVQILERNGQKCEKAVLKRDLKL